MWAGTAAGDVASFFHGLGSNFYCQSEDLFMGDLFSHQNPVVSKLKHEVKVRSAVAGLFNFCLLIFTQSLTEQNTRPYN